MSQLDISIFYSHLLGLLLVLYIFSHFSVIILSTYYYNYKLRNLEEKSETIFFGKVNKIDTLNKILE
uniref:ATP synthase F0 subunit 8 n=1 Tax=Blackfordia virginica TaxID=47071 RepID=A0A7U0QCW3_9CNID|nr:ATP synthase F0 subunit 8 [Blackfordia virginica]QQW46705.1 ATP synthase F0 subunit 8 [Blackfordia virginica]